MKIVKFDGNGGEVKKYAKRITKGKKLGTLPKPKRSGYKFKNWYTKKSGGTRRVKTSLVKTAGNFTLYAHWTRKK